MTSTLRDQIAELVRAGLQAAQDAGALPPFDIPAPIPVNSGRHAAHGDYDDYDIKQVRKFYKHIQSLLNNYNV